MCLGFTGHNLSQLLNSDIVAHRYRRCQMSACLFYLQKQIEICMWPVGNSLPIPEYPNVVFW